MTPQETLHSILLDAKARIKDGELYDDEGDKCVGICEFITWHTLCLNSSVYRDVYFYTHELLREYNSDHHSYKLYGKPYDFSDPKRLALLDWLIERTAP